MNNTLCEHGCGQVATYQTKGSSKSGQFNGRPVWQCAKHHSACPAIKQKKIDKSIEKYGTPYPWQTEDVRSKADQTNIEKYGHKCSAQGGSAKEKRRLTMIERYGVEQPTSNKQIAAKVSASVTQSYINDPTLAVRQIQARQQKYGTDYASIVAKTKATQIANGRWVDPSQLTEWQQYKRSVRYHTKKNYQLYKHLINPSNLPTGVCQYQVDHIYSIREGFENKIDPKVIGHQANLRMLWHIDNKSKHIRSDITLDELLKITKGT